MAFHPENITTVLFDFDGTLADTVTLCLESFRRASEACGGGNPSYEEIQALFGPDETGILERLLPNADEAQITEAVRLYEHFYRELHEELAPQTYPGVIEFLSELKQRGHTIGLVTGKALPSAIISLDYYGLTPFFDVLKGGSRHGVIKENCMVEILDETNADVSQAVYLGDAIADAHSCRIAGIPIIAATWNERADAQRLKEEGAVALPEKFSDLFSLFGFTNK